MEAEFPMHSSLPLSLTTFVGRLTESTMLSNLLLDKRLLTLVGAGGIGKTRLAFHIAETVRPSFPDGISLVDLAPLSDARLVAQTLASVLAVRTDKDVPLLTLLITMLHTRHSLLLFDNCEHVLSGCVPLIEALLQTCPHLHILATSREPLNIAGETVWRVATLSLPSLDQLPPTDQLVDYEAIQLFCDRAADINPSFQLTSRNAAAIAAICAQLDGLPLALELAAARLPVLTVHQIAERLHERFALLRNGKRTAVSRQQTLQATLDWSYALLTPDEQRLFQRLAVFAGSWSLEAAEWLAQPVLSEAHMPFDVLSQLVNKSLVLAEEQAGARPGTTEIRYRFLETMQQYAEEKLKEAGEWQVMCEHLCEWYLRLAQEANEHLYVADQGLWLHRLDVESSNLRHILSRAFVTGELDVVVRLADTLRRFWITRARFAEGRYWFEALLTEDNEKRRLSPVLRARVLFGAAEFARYQGAYEHTEKLLEEQVTLLEQIGDVVGLAEARSYLGLITGLRGDYLRATILCEDSLSFYRQRRDYSGVASTLTTLAFVTLAQGNYRRAITLSEEVCKLLRAAGNYVYLLYALFTLAQAALLQGDRDIARTTCSEALHLAQAQKQTYGIAASLGLIGGLAGLEGLSVQAARFFGAAQVLQESVQAPHPPAGRALQERMLLSIRADLGREQFATHYAAGQSAQLEQILHEAEGVLQQQPAALATPISGYLPSTSSSDASLLTTLSKREREVLVLVATGLTDAEIADTLHLSKRTVGKHLQSVYTKLGVKSRSAATRYALEYNLV